MRWFALILLFSAAVANAADWDDLKRACHRSALHGPGFHWTEECIQNIFTLRPIHPAIASIAPGTKIGLGGGLDWVKRYSRTEILPSGSYVHSTTGANLARAGITVAVPPFSFVRVDEDSTSVVQVEVTEPDGAVIKKPIQEVGYHDTRTKERIPESTTREHIRLVRDAWQVDSKLSFAFTLQWADLRPQAFYGLGPLTSRSGLTYYGIRQTSVQLAINDPITTFAEVGIEEEFIRPRAYDVNDAGGPAISQLYNSATAPALVSHSDFLRTEPYLRVRLPVRRRFLRLTEFKLGYSLYHDLGSAQFSFRRLKADGRWEYDLRIPHQNTASNTPALSRFLCPVGRTHYCTLGTLTLDAEVSAAYTSSNSIVPFFFDETLGGADTYGNDTLRGFADYRFRGPSRMFFQAEFRHRIYGPFGAYIFADSGRVALSASDLAFEHLRHDFGPGLYVSATNRIVLRAYLGFGTREALKPNAKPNFSF